VTSALLSINRSDADDPFYYSWLNTNLSQSLLSRRLYEHPYFLRPQSFIGEWLYVGRQGTGVTPHIDHMCVAKWSFQIMGCKRWNIASSTPTLHPFLHPLSFQLCAGETLVFWPDHIHSTQCLDPACASLNGYIQLEYDSNCYLQSMMEEAEAAAPLAPRMGKGQEAFVMYRSRGAGVTQLEAPMDYANKCPQHFRSYTRQCIAAAAAAAAAGDSTATSSSDNGASATTMTSV
jgi:hypothetical protein